VSNFDFLVIGSGPAGQRAAIQAAKLGKTVGLIDRWPEVGGVLVHTGTIPSKTLREAILYLTGWHQRGFYGRDYRVKPVINIDDLKQRLTFTIEHETEVMRNQLVRNGVEIIRGTASFLDPHKLRVDTADGTASEYRAEKILIATGTYPRRPSDVPFDDETIVDSDDLLRLKSLPRRLTVVGAGVIGIEYASMFCALDVEVTLVHERPTMLGFLDRDLAQEFMRRMKETGMEFRLGSRIENIARDKGDNIVTRLADRSEIESDVLLYTAGRTGCTSALKLKNAGLAANKREQLDVNAHYQTAVPHIYAAGDIIGFPSLGSISMEQGRLVARHAFGQAVHNHLGSFPYGIYTVPEISMIGRTEQELIEQNITYEAGVARYRETARAQIMGLSEGMLKLLVDRHDQRLLGVHIIGHGATELIHIGQAVMRLDGTLDYFVDNVFNYPTLAETYKIAALDASNRLAT
jgi:NAD(P) transhydrogenase